MIFHVQMAHLFNRNFAEIAVDSHNYLSWTINVKIMLTTKAFIDDINKPNTQAHISDTTEYNTLILET